MKKMPNYSYINRCLLVIINVVGLIFITIICNQLIERLTPESKIASSSSSLVARSNPQARREAKGDVTRLQNELQEAEVMRLQNELQEAGAEVIRLQNELQEAEAEATPSLKENQKEFENANSSCIR